MTCHMTCQGLQEVCSVGYMTPLRLGKPTEAAYQTDNLRGVAMDISVHQFPPLLCYSI